jgi:peptide/nickel transport system substrate-binding protein
MKGILSKLAVSAIALILAAGPAVSADPPKGTLRVGLHADTTIPDPHKTRNQASHMAMRHIVETLVTFDANYEIIPQLAEKWTINPAGDRYTFELRKGVLFHDGSELQAEDVRYSLLRLKEVSPNKADYADIRGIEIKDKYTLEIALAAPSPVFLSQLAGPFGGYIIPANLAEKQGGEISRPIGTGPFRWDEWRSDQFLRIKWFDKYSADARFPGPTGLGGKRTAEVEEIMFRILPDRASRVTSLETGQLDFSSRIDVSDFERLKKVKGITAVEVPTLEWVVLWFGWKLPPTSDLRFRQAVAAALNYDEIMQLATGGYGVTNPAFMHPEQKAWYTQRTGRQHPHDPQRARALLREVGYRGEPIELWTSTDVEYMSNAGLAIQQQLRAVGINVQIKNYDMSGLVAGVYATEPVYRMGMMTSSGRYDPDQHYNRRLHSTKSVNKYASAEYDALVDKARVVMDPKERLELYDRAQEVFMKDIPAVLLFNPSFFEAHRDTVKGFKPSATGLLQLWNVRIER